MYKYQGWSNGDKLWINIVSNYLLNLNLFKSIVTIIDNITP